MIYPPKIDPTFDLAPWSDALLEIIPENIESTLGDMDVLEKEYEAWCVIIAQDRAQEKWDAFTTYFQILYVENRFAYYPLHQKWLIYWLSLYEALPIEKPPMPQRPTYNNDDLDHIKQRPIEEFYEGKLRPLGNRLSGKCPFHEERTPSFFIFTDDNHFHCFSCQKHGDVIAFIMELKGMDFKEAKEFLK